MAPAPPPREVPFSYCWVRNQLEILVPQGRAASAGLALSVPPRLAKHRWREIEGLRRSNGAMNRAIAQAWTGLKRGEDGLDELVLDAAIERRGCTPNRSHLSAGQGKSHDAVSN